jgi:hypothetical protein|tara:strand:+ start:697 stop:897 length:201 start_codon:yes stop_codon:yes gene_type:complete
MANKTYLLTIEYNEDTEEIEYIQEEIIDPDESTTVKVLGLLDLEDMFNEDSLDIIKEVYTGEVGES